ncbi:MAG: hypothetical protein LBD24_05150, partial [Spirochaetaceae bacterium]|nr:hypothetical protein [Spirochaetaceae bacterium]
MTPHTPHRYFSTAFPARNPPAARRRRGHISVLRSGSKPDGQLTVVVRSAAHDVYGTAGGGVGDGGGSRSDYYLLPRNDLSIARDGSPPRKAGLKGIPFTASGIPFTTKGIPFTTKGIPFTASGIPFTTKGIPF